MSKKHIKKIRSGLILLIALGAVVDFTLLLYFLIKGKNIALFNAKGLVAQKQLDLMIFSVLVLLVIAIPTLLVLYAVAWRYRESNHKATYKPVAKSGKLFVWSIWVVPTIFMLILASAMLPATHELVPQNVIAHEKRPMKIQVVSLNWKWLFIYPEQDIASINFVQIPVDRPITFEMTADESPMSSFWIPNLGGQLYSMTTHVNRLNLMAESPGDYPGRSAEINGHGFSGMKFIARASSQTEFDTWVQDVKQSLNILDMEEYSGLLEHSENHPITFYSAHESNLFAKVIQKYYEPITTEEPHE